jgi:hypothetical protein
LLHTIVQKHEQHKHKKTCGDHRDKQGNLHKHIQEAGCSNSGKNPDFAIQNINVSPKPTQKLAYGDRFNCCLSAIKNSDNHTLMQFCGSLETYPRPQASVCNGSGGSSTCDDKVHDKQHTIALTS